MRYFYKTLWTSSALLILLAPPLKAEWRFGIFLGKASTSCADLKIEQPSRQNDLLFHNIEFSGRSFRTPLYYGLRTGYFPGNYPFLGLEAEFIHAKIYSNPQQMVHVSGIREGNLIDSTIHLGEMVQDFSMSHGLNFLFFNLAGRLKPFQEKVGLYGRLGIGALIPHTESTIEDVKKEQYEFHVPAYQLGAGTGINIWKKLNLLLEYKYTYVRVKDAKIPYGNAKTKLRTNHLVFGVERVF